MKKNIILILTLCSIISLISCDNNLKIELANKKWQYSITSLVELNQMLANNTATKIFDLRPQVEYTAGHFKDAIHFPLLDITNQDYAPHKTSQLNKILSQKGITLDDQIVLIDNGGILSAARFFWILNYLGIDNVYIYTGRINTIMKQQYLNDIKVKKYPMSDFVANINSAVITTKDILFLSLQDEATSVLDVRSQMSHLLKLKIKGTQHFPWTLREGETPLIYIESDSDKKIIEDKFKTISNNSMSFCKKGRHSSLMYFYGKNIGKMISHFPGGIKSLVQDDRFIKINNEQ